jgi:CHAT domain-containing protein/tetratricopeptide (TPR) repeat protein
LGPDHPNVARALNNLGQLLVTTQRLSEAEPLLRRALTIDEQRFGRDHPNVGRDLNNLAQLLKHAGRPIEVEPLMRRALAIEEKSSGPNHPRFASMLGNLAEFLQGTGRVTEAEPLLRRAYSIDEQSFGTDHPKVAIDLHNLAGALAASKRFAEAEPLMRRALSITEKAYGPNHSDVAVRLNSLAELLQGIGRGAEAEPLLRRSLAISENNLGPNHPSVAVHLNNLALLLQRANRFADAEPMMRRALAIDEKAYGLRHPMIALRLINLAQMVANRGDWVESVSLHSRAKPILVAARGEGDRGGISKSILASNTWALREYARALHRANPTALAAREESFELAQWALQTEAAEALGQMSSRFAKGDGLLSHLVREQQDLLARRSVETRNLDMATGRGDTGVAETLRSAVATINLRLDEIDSRIAKEFKDYAALSTPNPLTPRELQALLGEQETLVLFLEVPSAHRIPEEALAWAVTKTDMRWERIAVGPGGIRGRVAELRCGLDLTAWDGDGAARCGQLLKTSYTQEEAKAGKPLPFDLSRAHDLYQALFGRMKDMIRDKHLLIVSSGSLTAMPIQALVTEKPAEAIPVDVTGFRNAAWLAKRHAITVLPAVSSLKALRELAKASNAKHPFIGFGNPLLSGPDGSDRRAWERQSCKSSPPMANVASRRVRGAIPNLFRNGLADIEEVRAQYPLPETADELCAVARSTGAADGAVYLGEKASEVTVKALSANGALAQAKVVHFATHGLLAGETAMLAAARAEPALILTPPLKASEQDDGLLTASEITQLKLDADWVVLSACNTAAGESEKPGAEALSGLARAFFYAGARALLVSHWAVNSEATVQLITRAFDELKADPKIGRAEALRRSMLALIGAGGGYAHPANWAPFVVVGEGAARH